MLARITRNLASVVVAMAVTAGLAQAVSAADAPMCVPRWACGDVNASGSVTATDALKVLQEAVGLDAGLVCECMEAVPMVLPGDSDAPACVAVGVCGDVNASGSLTATDALRVLQEAVGPSTGLVCECAASSAPVEFSVDEPLVPVSTSFQLSARFTQIADQSAKWAVVSDPAVGSVTENGLYTAGPAPGDDIVEVTSLADPGLKRQQTVRVRAADQLAIYWNTSNPYGVDNGAMSPQFQVTTPVLAHSLDTYHWNYGSGTSSPGTLGLRRLEDDKVFGPWPATGWGTIDSPNLYWTVILGGLVLDAGTYEVLDSDPSTWSQNTESGGFGMGWMYEWVLP